MQDKEGKYCGQTLPFSGIIIGLDPSVGAAAVGLLLTFLLYSRHMYTFSL